MLRITQIPPAAAAKPGGQRFDGSSQNYELSSGFENMRNALQETRKIIKMLDNVERGYNVESFTGELGQGNRELMPFFVDDPAARFGKVHSESCGTPFSRVVEQFSRTASNIQDPGSGADVPVEFMDQFDVLHRFKMLATPARSTGSRRIEGPRRFFLHGVLRKPGLAIVTSPDFRLLFAHY